MTFFGSLCLYADERRRRGYKSCCLFDRFSLVSPPTFFSSCPYLSSNNPSNFHPLFRAPLGPNTTQDLSPAWRTLSHYTASVRFEISRKVCHSAATTAEALGEIRACLGFILLFSRDDCFDTMLWCGSGLN